MFTIGLISIAVLTLAFVLNMYLQKIQSATGTVKYFKTSAF